MINEVSFADRHSFEGQSEEPMEDLSLPMLDSLV